ncbi:MAG TPA: cysteine hydrolase family protein [Symbiobacteriaceae bacterium]|nr:cysteine hydrolase family protein [Symbiobacteriaceae bacterium]
METALVVIDVQVGVVESAHDAAGVLERIRQLQDRARAAGVPVVHVQHHDPDGVGSPLEQGKPAWEIHPTVAPAAGEPVVHKMQCDSFHETDLQQVLGRLGARRLVIAGCQTDYCVDTSCRRAVTLGYSVTLAADAHSTVGNGVLTAEQIIAHHNQTLRGFGSEEAHIRVVPAAEIEL